MERLVVFLDNEIYGGSERLQRLDEEAAEVVRHIFSLTLEGYGPYNSYIKDQRHSKFLVFRMMINC